MPESWVVCQGLLLLHCVAKAEEESGNEAMPNKQLRVALFPQSIN